MCSSGRACVLPPHLQSAGALYHPHPRAAYASILPRPPQACSPCGCHCRCNLNPDRCAARLHPCAAAVTASLGPGAADRNLLTMYAPATSAVSSTPPAPAGTRGHALHKQCAREECRQGRAQRLPSPSPRQPNQQPFRLATLLPPHSPHPPLPAPRPSCPPPHQGTAPGQQHMHAFAPPQTACAAARPACQQLSHMPSLQASPAWRR